MGRKTEPASPEMLDAFLQQLSAGEKRKDLHDDPMMPTRWQVALAARTSDEFAGLLRDAEVIGLQVMADDLLSIADNSSRDIRVDEQGRERVDTEVLMRSKLRIETRQWMLERRLAELYTIRKDAALQVNQYFVELPAPVESKEEWLQKHRQSTLQSNASASGDPNRDPKPH